MTRTTSDGLAQIWRGAVPGRGGEQIATALDPAAVRHNWPFGPSLYWFVTGDRCERHEVGRTRTGSDGDLCPDHATARLT